MNCPAAPDPNDLHFATDDACSDLTRVLDVLRRMSIPLLSVVCCLTGEGRYAIRVAFHAPSEMAAATLRARVSGFVGVFEDVPPLPVNTVRRGMKPAPVHSPDV